MIKVNGSAHVDKAVARNLSVLNFGFCRDGRVRRVQRVVGVRRDSACTKRAVDDTKPVHIVGKRNADTLKGNSAKLNIRCCGRSIGHGTLN